MILDGKVAIDDKEQMMTLLNQEKDELMRENQVGRHKLSVQSRSVFFLLTRLSLPSGSQTRDGRAAQSLYRPPRSSTS